MLIEIKKERGFKTLLVEKSDFSKGTSSRSTKLVHGGVRYMQNGDISLVIEALKEILVDANWEFIPPDPNDEEQSKHAGIKILAVNHKEGMLVHLRLCHRLHRAPTCTQVSLNRI